MSINPVILNFSPSSDEALFAHIAEDIHYQGYSVNTSALSPVLCQALLEQLHQLNTEAFEPAGIGRSQLHQLDRAIRSDKIHWISRDHEAGRLWLDWCDGLKTTINRQLFMGLFSFESHFAHYPPGASYQRHYDAFRGEANRVLSVVAYLNPEWQAHEGGALSLYANDEDRFGLTVLPELGTVVVFLSEEFPHEVHASLCDRYSIAGWFRVNTSIGGKIDPPR